MITAQMEVAGDEIKSKIDAKDLLIDLKVLIKEFIAEVLLMTGSLWY